MPTALKIDWKNEIKDYLIITFGLFLYALGFKCFIVPNEITCGGTTGLGAVILYATGWWKIEYTFFLCNALLLCLAFYHLTLRFCLKTMFSVVMLTLLLAGMEEGMRMWYYCNPELFPAGFNATLRLPILVDNVFMSSIVGASIMGMGMGLVFLRNGSTGGTDVIAAVINKYKDLSLGTVILFSDLVIISSSMSLPNGNFEKLLYGCITLLITTLMVDYVVNSGQQSVQFLIFSEKYDDIASEINLLHRGVTVLSGQGWYTKSERKVLVVLAKKRESPIIFRIIQTIDPNAFVSQSLVRGVFGYGFDRLKIKSKKQKKNSTTSPSANTPSSTQHLAQS